MADPFDPEHAFPEEVVAEIREGARVPALYSGPLYTGNGAVKARQELDERIKALGAAGNKPGDVAAKLAAIAAELPDDSFFTTGR